MKRFGIEYYKEYSIESLGTYHHFTIYYGNRYRTWIYLTKDKQ